MGTAAAALAAAVTFSDPPAPGGAEKGV